MGYASGFSLNDMISRLHGMVRSFAMGMERVIEENRKIPEKEIKELINRISERLGGGNETADNGKVIDLLNLLMKDQHVLKIVKENADEWTNMLDALEGHVSKKGGSAEEKKEIIKIRRLTDEMRNLIRN